jgi:hypothetical protein
LPTSPWPRQSEQPQQQRRRHHLDGDLHADSDVTDTSNLITLNNTGCGCCGQRRSRHHGLEQLRHRHPAPDGHHRGGDTALAAGETLVTITFSEAVSGLTTADLTVATAR